MKQPPPTTPISLNLAPMVDVIMCLLVFFMVTTRMVEQENSSRIDLPLAKAAKDVDKDELGFRFVVNVLDGRISGGSGAAYVVQENEVSYQEVIDGLRRAREQNPDVNCIIRGDRSLPYEYVQAVMIGCARAGVQKVTFSAVPREGA